MLRRGLPYSVFVHVLGLTLALVFGNRVATVPMQPPRSIRVQMVQMPRAVPQSQPEPVTAPVVQTPQPEIKPDLPPKELPKPKPEPKPAVKKPQPEIKAPDPEPDTETLPATTETPLAQAALAPPSVTGTDEEFPFDWYIALVEGKIVNNWKPTQLNFGKRAVVSCTVHFRIARNGTVSQVSLVRNSGVGVYDRESLRAVTTTRLPPLPPQFKGTSLGITFIFNQEPRQ